MGLLPGVGNELILLFLRWSGGEEEEVELVGDGARSARVAGSISRSGMGGERTGRRVMRRRTSLRKALESIRVVSIWGRQRAEGATHLTISTRMMLRHMVFCFAFNPRRSVISKTSWR